MNLRNAATLSVVAMMTVVGRTAAREIIGPAVGVRTLDIVDASRHDLLRPDLDREWTVTVLYPAQVSAVGKTEQYIPDTALVRELAEQMMPDTAAAAEVRRNATLPTNLVRGATPSRGAHPLVLLSPGWGASGMSYQLLGTAFVRLGFVVAIVDHPYLGVDHLPNGRFLLFSDDSAGQSGTADGLAPRIADWTRDLSLVIDRLLAADRSGSALGIDVTRIVAAGHSSGGTIALDACRADPRIKACIDFDGAHEGSQTSTAGPGGPTLFVLSAAVYTDAELARIGRTREMMAKRRRGVMDAITAVLEKGSAPAWIANVSGGGHMSFSDAPAVSPSLLTRFGGTYMTAERSREVYAGLVAAFARAYWPGGGGASEFARYATRVPEVELRRVVKVPR